MTIDQINIALSGLQAALARGELRVRLGDSEVTYQSAADIVLRLAQLRSERAALTAGLGTYRMRSYPVAMRRD